MMLVPFLEICRENRSDSEWKGLAVGPHNDLSAPLISVGPVSPLILTTETHKT